MMRPILLVLLVVATVVYGQACGDIDLTSGNVTPYLTCVSATSVTAIGSTSLQAAALDNLQQITGDITIKGNSNALTVVAFSKLTSIGGSIYVQNNPAVTILYIPQLTSVHNFYITDNAINWMDISKLYEVFDARWQGNGFSSVTLPFHTAFFVGVTGNGASAVELPQLTQIGYELVVGASSLMSIRVPQLSYVYGGIYFESNNVLTGISLPQLTMINGGSMGVTDNSHLTNIYMPKLTTLNMLTILNNPLLSSMDVPKLTSHGQLTLQTIPTIFSCDSVLVSQYNAICVPTAQSHTAAPVAAAAAVKVEPAYKSVSAQRMLEAKLSIQQFKDGIKAAAVKHA